MELHDISVLIIFGVLSALLFFDKITFDWYAGIIVAILGYFNVKLGIYIIKKEK